MKHPVILKQIVEANFLEPVEPGEKFRLLVDQCGNSYYISSHGRLYSFLSQRYIKGNQRQVNSQVYCQYMLSDHRWRSTHQLVMQAFGPPKPSNDHEIDHIDNNGTNNKIENLQWVTKSENIQLSYERGRKRLSGSAHWLSGKSPSNETRQLMSEAKKGEKHPKFKGWWIVNGVRYVSTQAAADATGTYPKKIYNDCMAGRNGCSFLPKQAN